MVVIVIIGILGTSAVFFFGGAADDAKISRAVSELRLFVDNIGIYKLKNNGAYPQDLKDLNTLKDVKIPDFDPWGRPYDYQVDANGFTVTSKGANETDPNDDVWYSSERNKYMKPGDRVE